MSFTANTNRSQYPNLFGPTQLAQLEMLTLDHGEFPDSKRETLFRHAKAEADIWRSQDILDLPLATLIPEGTAFSSSRPAQGFAKTFTPYKKGGMVSLTKEMIEDFRVDAMSAWAKKLGESIAQTREIDAMNIYNNAFSSVVAQDGLSLINASHVVGDLTFSNALANNPDLSETSLQAALSQFETAFIRSNGTYINLKPRYLVVAPGNKRYAKELVGSEGKPDTADNNMNSMRDDGLIVVSSPYLTDSIGWFLQAAPEQTGLFIVERQGIETASSGFNEGVGFTTDSALIKASYREDIGVTNAYGILGSSGT